MLSSNGDALFSHALRYVNEWVDGWVGRPPAVIPLRVCFYARQIRN